MLLKKLRDPGCAEYSVISTDPPVFYLYHGRNFEQVYRLVRGSAAYFLFAFAECKEDQAEVDRLRKYTSRHEKKFPGHKFIYLCNSSKELELLRENELDALLINHNCFVDERIFAVKPGAKKIYDAVYDAQLARMKRHYLASGIESLALITYFFYPGLKEPFVSDVIGRFERAHWFNKPFRKDYRILTPEEVSGYLNQCRVGLCLSAAEGGMYASVQYMLSGLPVVSTRSKGGRDEFFDDRYVKIVDDDPEAVRRGVEELIERNVPPDLIHGETIKKMTVHRERFIALIEGIYRDHGIKKDFREEWGRIFFNKMVELRKLGDAKRILSENRDAP